MSKKKGGFMELLYKTIMPKVYGIGAAVVIVGALFKILHLTGADEMLMIEGNMTGRIQRPAGQFPPPGNGGHAMLVVGYDDASQSWLVRNSWGESYGEAGYVWIDYQVMDAYSDAHEFWTIGAIEGRPGLSLIGPSVHQTMQQAQQQAPQQVTSVLNAMRQALGKDLSSSLEQKRQGIRERLRGPGAGGGY